MKRLKDIGVDLDIEEKKNNEIKTPITAEVIEPEEVEIINNKSCEEKLKTDKVIKENEQIITILVPSFNY